MEGLAHFVSKSFSENQKSSAAAVAAVVRCSSPELDVDILRDTQSPVSPTLSHNHLNTSSSEIDMSRESPPLIVSDEPSSNHSSTKNKTLQGHSLLLTPPLSQDKKSFQGRLHFKHIQY